MTKEVVETVDYRILSPWVTSVMLPLGWRKLPSLEVVHPFLDGIRVTVYVVTDPSDFSAHARVDIGSPRNSYSESVLCSYEEFELESFRGPLLNMVKEGEKHFKRILSRVLAKNIEDLPRLMLNERSLSREVAERILAGDEEWLKSAKKYAGLS